MASKQTFGFEHTVNWGRMIFLTVFFVLTFLGVPLYFLKFRQAPVQLWEISFFLFLCVSCGMAITVGYHRLFAHRTFKAAAWVKCACLFFGAAAFENSAVRWSAQHRDHHRYVDDRGDPYNIREGFFHAHIGWLWFRIHQYHYYGVKDLIADPLVRCQHRYYAFWVLGAAFLLPMIPVLWTGDWIGAFLLFVVARITLVHHSSMFVNSVCHYFGKPAYDPSVSARDSWVAALLTYGEGFHSYHHRFPNDYRNGVKWYHWDPSKWLIAFLGMLGLVWDLKRVSKTQISEALEEARTQKIPALST